MPVEIRRTLTLVQTTLKEGWKEVAESTRLINAIAIIRNPWFGRKHVEDLGPEIRAAGPDAPADNEIIIALGASCGGHPNHRIGNRYGDLKEMGHDIDNPAGV